MVIRGVARSAPARLAISLVVGVFVLLLVSLLSSLLLGLLSGIAGMGCGVRAHRSSGALADDA